MSEKLRQFLAEASRNYYNGSPTISDEVFDKLAATIDYEEVGAKTSRPTIPHLYPMYSLQKFYEDEGKENPLLGHAVDSSPKIDGAAVSHLFINGQYVRSLTRGDGIEGTDVTDKFLTTNLIPKSIPINDWPILQITGEIAAPKHIENARNYAAGSLSLKDTEEFKTRAVEFFAYGASPSLTSKFSTDMKLLSAWGFNTVKDPEIHNIYPCDGIVYRIDNNAIFEELGYTSKHPRGAFALKERGIAVETNILDVVWQVGKTGKVTPVAILEPIMINDALVSRATLNNISFIRALDLRIGDRVGVVRAGEIIPQVTHKVE